jgi:hypothetical protein
MEFLLAQLKIFFTNRTGLILVFTNFVLVIWGLAEKGWNYNIFHYYYEPIPIKIFTVINAIAIALAGEVNNLLYPPPETGWSFVIISNFELMLLVVFSISQWLLIGYLLDLMFRLGQEKIK